jgi:hypothetical protein
MADFWTNNMLKEDGYNFIPRSISDKEAADTGMAMTLILLLLGYFTGNPMYFLLAIPVQLLNMIWPSAFRPLAYIWLGLTNLLGTVMSKIILSIIFFMVVLPMGLFRRATGKDPLQLKKFRKDKSSVMVERNHNFGSNDLANPF